jgi:branched-chain amino acid transport system permease protein
MYALIALGYTLVYGILLMINFAHSEMFMLGAYVGLGVLTVLSNPSVPASGFFTGSTFGIICLYAIAFAISMVAIGVVGVIIERLAYRPLRNAPRIASLITAIGISFLLEYGGQLVFGPDPKFFPTLIPKHRFNWGGMALTSYQVIVLVVALVFMAILQYIVFKTKFGRALRAVSYNFETASLMGIPTDQVIARTFIIGSVLAAVAGILYGLSYAKIDPLMGVMLGLKAFVAAVLGGIGNVPGAMIGGLIIGVVEAFVGGSSFSTYRDAIAFVILILILLFRPSGILGRYQAEKV